ncbi:transglutaminase domain-containing protein, partial [Fulvivirga sp. RKSG066]|uniref:transglutaminase-like domain-containing protein n=1 Tax=Fulvivirga aurantia TaxID=2529383 RepID=UPI0012BB6341
STDYKRVSISEIETGIQQYIQEKTKADDGYFKIEDGDSLLRLKLVRVHTEYLSNLGPQRYFACVDLAEVDGNVYDVDFFLSGEPGNMTVTETTVHKLNGKPFYTWKQRKDKTWHRVAVENADNRLMGVIEKEDKFEFTYEAKLPEMKEPSRLWLPLAQTDDFQDVEIVSVKTPVKHQILQEDDYQNSMMYLELTPAQSGSTVAVTYKVKRKEKSSYSADDKNLERYLQGSELLPVGGRFKEIVDEILIKTPEDNKLMQARAIYDYIIDNVAYKKVGVYGTGDANYACDAKSGNCTEFHSFFISLARTAGIPARFAIGASIPSERNEGGINGYHCWAEFYAEGKWWPIDISEGNKYTPLATYYFGHHPANRIELSRGRDLQPNPGPSSGPINFHAYPVLEVNGKKTDVKTTFSFMRG